MRASLSRDGVEGNRRLTAMLGAVLLVLLAIEGGTIPFLSSLEVVHVAVGLILIPVVLVKLASTTYRFARYYTRDPDYMRAGPPILILRAVGPLVALTSAVLLGSGVALAVIGHHSWMCSATCGRCRAWHCATCAPSSG